MASSKSRGLFRARGLRSDTTEGEFQSALSSLLTPEERQEFTLEYVHLVPACRFSEDQVAIFKYSPAPGPFSLISRLGRELDLGENWRDVLLDIEFAGLTQLFQVNPTDIKME
ncbi:hypothetical protein ABW19_dt0208499 [Dactylella cylindrospora]|nr:hypothetical protein ABW19_dt0208499 [Dactylella cylindrospora]